jgi:glycosyltransferase involved in cell wall biosynthesis
VRIVVALPFTPWPVASGTDRLAINLLEGLRARHETTLVTMTLSPRDLERLSEIERPGLSVRAILAPHRRGAAGRIWHKARTTAIELLEGVPAQVSYAAPPLLLRHIAGTAAEARADLVLANYWHLYRLPAFVRGPRLALVTHDLDFLVAPLRAKLQGGRPGRRARAAERIELEAYRSYDTILTVTGADAEALAAHPAAAGKRVIPLPLAMDLSAFSPPAERRETDTVLVMGTFHSDFNLDALRFFIDGIVPPLLEMRAGARIVVVGRGVPDGIKTSAPPAVVFTGGVEDVAPYLRRCSAMALPIRFCGGVRIRMMEAAAAGTPTVSTAIGVAGMGLEPGRDYLEADDPRRFAEALARILSDEGEARRLGENARRWAEERLSMESYPERLDRMLEQIMA